MRQVGPKLSITLLIGIRVLCNAGCKVLFTKTKYEVWYKGKVILTGKKNPSTDLWTLPMGPDIEQAKKPIVEPTSVSSALRRVGQSPKKSTTVPSDAHD